MSRYIPVSRKSDIVVQEFENEVLVYDLKRQKAFCLNETAAKVWQVCDGNKSVSEISAFLSSVVSLDYTEDVVILAIEQLRKDGLLEKNQSNDFEFPDVNRRQLIRKIGLASVIALPFISSLVAPSAACAQSCSVMAPGSGCSNPGTFCAAATNMCCTCNCAVQPTGPRRCV